LPQLSRIEKRGIPLVMIVYGDQDECLNQSSRLHGVPNLRRVHVSRTLSGIEDVDRFIGPLMDALVRPLTAKEKEKGTWEVPDPRILFEGTLQEAQEFYQQTDVIPQLDGASIARYTDGLPVVIPTEEAVEKMLKGTSHKPDEVVTFQADHRLDRRSVDMGMSGKKGDAVLFLNMRRKATVEKVATVGVMAGCRPEHMPLLLTIAESGGGCGDGRGGTGLIVSGPYSRQIGMNFGVGLLGPGNNANRSLGRAAELMWRNFGGAVPNVTTCSIFGKALTNVIPENNDALPPGWKGINEEYGFKKEESVLMTLFGGNNGMSSIHIAPMMPGGYRAFQKTGHGAIARALDVKGKPGPHNLLEYLIPGNGKGGEGSYTFLMLPELANDLCKYGFKTKEEVYEWIWKRSYIPLKDYRNQSPADIATGGWSGIERTSGKPWRELPDDYMVPVGGPTPWGNCIIVSGAGEEALLWFNGRGGGSFGGADNAFNIDVWR
jgi:hypothetical protein